MLEDPGGRAPAPGALRAIQAFVNTIDIEHGRELLDRPERLRDVLVEQGLLDPAAEVGGADLQRALEVREAFRRLLLANNGGDVGRDTLDVLERTAAAAGLTVGFDDQAQPGFEAQVGGVEGALGRLVAIVPIATAEGTWPRLKACRRDVCHWVFYDQSRNRSSTWCAMSVCGNRTKTRAFRRRAAGRA
jgi:predicted RNA-binding Zn ribbon-like protein